MSTRRIALVSSACAAVLALAVLVPARRAAGPRLPAEAPYPALPAAFGQALRQARARAAAGRADDVRALARLYEANRLFAEAKACYRVVAAGSGGLSGRDHYYLAAIAQAESDLDAAADELRATLRAEPAYVPARLALADALFKTGRPDEAAEECSAALGADPQNPQALFGLARVELQRGGDDKAVALLRELVARHPDSASGAGLLAQILERMGEADESAAMRERSQQAHEPVAPDPWLDALLVDCYDLEQIGIAFEAYRLADQLDEALPLLDRLEQLDPRGWMGPMLRGWSMRKAGRYRDAEREYRLALANGGDPERICPLLANALLTEGDNARAASLLADYHAKFPHSVPLLLSYAETAARMKDDSLARSLLTDVLRIEPGLYLPNMTMVQILWDAGERDAASQYLLRVARMFPADVDSRSLLGQYYLGKGEAASAVAPLEEGLASAPPRDPRRERLTRMLDTAYLAAGSVAAGHGSFPEAVAYAEKSIALVPDGLRGYALKANACRRMGDTAGAVRAIETMAALAPGDPSLPMSLGDALYEGGRRDEARAHWRRALEMAPADAAELRGALAQRLAAGLPPWPAR